VPRYPVHFNGIPKRTEPLQRTSAKSQIENICTLFNNQYSFLKMSSDRWGSYLKIETIPQRGKYQHSYSSKSNLDSSAKKNERITFADGQPNFKVMDSLEDQNNPRSLNKFSSQESGTLNEEGVLRVLNSSSELDIQLLEATSD
jgi:hypothetical protein